MSTDIGKTWSGLFCLIAHAAELPLEHLQLSLSTTDALRQRGMGNIADLIKTVGTEKYPSLECKIALEALEHLAQACKPEGIDWYRYWKGRGFEFNHMCLTCTELDRFVKDSADCSVNRTNLGKAAAMLGCAGYGTVTKLTEGLKIGIREVPGIGATKQKEFFKHLMQLINDLRYNRITPQELAKKFPILVDKPNVESPSTEYNFHESVLCLGIEVLHTGVNTKLLKSAGYKKVGDITSEGAKAILSLSYLGKHSHKKIKRSLIGLSKAQTSSGAIDWDVYCKELEIPLLPPNRMIKDGNSFVAMVSTTIGQLGKTLEDPVLQKILSERISKRRHERATLKEIGSMLAVPLTKERIRQRETTILESLAAALVHDDYSGIDFHFRPEFSSYWKRAAEHFSDSGEDIPFEALVDGLIKTWGVAKDVLYEHLPLITAVISGELMSSALRGDAARPDARLPSLPETTMAISLRHLQIGRNARVLQSQGINTVGDLVGKIIRGEVLRSSNSYIRAAMDHLEVVAETLDPVQGIDWPRYLKLTQTRTFPTKRVENASGFFSNLQENISEFLEANPSNRHSRDIFELRFSRPKATRMTLAQVASALNTIAPTINRHEKESLAYLNNVLLERDYSLAGVHLGSEYARMWDQIGVVFDKVDGDAELLQKGLAARFDLSEAQIEPAMPTMIAVLTGYPYRGLKRYIRRKRDFPIIDDKPETEEIYSEPVQLDRVKLKGFRQPH